MWEVHPFIINLCCLGECCVVFEKLVVFRCAIESFTCDQFLDFWRKLPEMYKMHVSRQLYCFSIRLGYIAVLTVHLFSRYFN